MSPRRTREEKYQIDFFPQIAVPLLVRDVFEPVEVRRGSIIEQHVDPAVRAHGKIDQRSTLGGIGQVGWLQGDHRATLSADHFSRGFRGGDVYIAADDRSILVGECEGGRAAYAPAGPRDDAHLARKPA